MLETIERALTALARAGIVVDAELLERLERAGVKTVGYFTDVLETWVRSLYRGKVSEYDFVSKLADLIAQQLRRAWYEGMRLNELDPTTDMTPEYEGELQAIILNEYAYVDAFAHEIALAAAKEQSVEPYLLRARMWANRYNDVVNAAVMATAGEKDKLKWIYGDAEHCSTCQRLNGIVATRREWERADVKPQAPPNHKLECEGWQCKCHLEPTTERKTPNAYERIVSIVGRPDYLV